MKRWQSSRSAAVRLIAVLSLILGAAAGSLLFYLCGSGTSAFGDSASPPSEGWPKGIWSDLLQKTPYPHTAPLPPPNATPLDATYVKFDPKETPPVHCRRCPDYAPEGGIWKLRLEKGIFRIFHETTGWRSIGSFVVDANRVRFFNDPCCLKDIGSYNWTLDNGRLQLRVVEDKCAIGLRAMNLMQLPWQSCQPPSREAAITDHWVKPTGCD